jgi:hypothetical protein
LCAECTIGKSQVVLARRMRKGDDTWVLRSAAGEPLWSSGVTEPRGFWTTKKVLLTVVVIKLVALATVLRHERTYMAEPSPSPRSNATDDDTATPRWVKVFGIITVVVVVLFLILMFSRGPGGRGPGGHNPFRHFGGQAYSEGPYA